MTPFSAKRLHPQPFPLKERGSPAQTSAVVCKVANAVAVLPFKGELEGV